MAPPNSRYSKICVAREIFLFLDLFCFPLSLFFVFSVFIVVYLIKMVKGFWKKLNKPIFALAPMADVTDAAFRRVVAKHSGKKRGGVPYITFTEFVSSDGLCSDKGREKLLPILKYTERERPIVAQIFGAKPENFYKAAKIIKKLGFDGIDINMGCPDKKVLKQGGGAILMKNPDLAQEIIRQTKKGAEKLPVSIKTRIGYDKYDKKEFKKWLTVLLEIKPAAVTIHARTKKEMSLAPAHWDIIAEAVKIRNEFYSFKPACRQAENRTLILGNGDVKSLTDAEKKVKETGVDGVMIGRGVFGNPWLFSSTSSEQAPLNKKLSVLLEHAKLFEKINKGKKFDVMKKHFKAYASGFSSAKELRIKLMACGNASEVEKIIKRELS